LGIAIGGIFAFLFSDFIINRILLGPAQPDFITYRLLGFEAEPIVMQNRKLAGQFFTYMGAMLMVGGIIGAPVLIYQLWAFVRPALEEQELKKSRYTFAFISLLFFLGVSFGYFIVTPFALQFFNTFQISGIVRNDFDINEYFSAISTWVIGCGIIFQLPVVAYFLTSIGLITPQFLRTYRRHAIVMNFIIAAIVTPPDVMSQIMVAIPMVFLYEFGIRVSERAFISREKAIWGDSRPNA
jgi:sec-independent protein translocase protein TatC